MSAEEKRKILALVDYSGLPSRKTLRELGLPKSTNNRWLWNKLSPGEEEKILSLARASPELSARQLALRIIDSEGLYVSEYIKGTIGK